MNFSSKLAILALLALGLVLLKCQWWPERFSYGSELPPLTQEGRQTFGCLVNGKPWTNDPNTVTKDLIAHYGKGSFMLLALNNSDHSRIMMSLDSGIYGPGQYLLTPKSSGHRNSTYFASNKDHFPVSSEEQAELIITRLDTIQRVLSGRFSFTAQNEHGERIQIKDGRFDVQLQR